ncbi:Uncharacterised protein [Candidatus Bilamarchaeum dharawalense]|uniref:DUF4352 domain-containing protein n=1 Tax=Candidatus Bilamarchaeum dharawalense TaxID=2885759 RepID=A0A5E4LMA7_9ARCH|nr:Uncharacterised protein [Candidatus Bilamarchaeum dharawalense]
MATKSLIVLILGLILFGCCGGFNPNEKIQVEAGSAQLSGDMLIVPVDVTNTGGQTSNVILASANVVMPDGTQINRIMPLGSECYRGLVGEQLAPGAKKTMDICYGLPSGTAVSGSKMYITIRYDFWYDGLEIKGGRVIQKNFDLS